MKNKKVDIKRIAIESIRQKSFRSFALVFLLMIFSFSLFFGSILSHSLSKGMNSLSDRLGADVMVVPEGYDAKIDSILLSGKPNTFSLPKGSIDKVRKVEGVEKVSGQTFIATLTASCCSYPLQIVGIDFDSDFIIKPWLENNIDKKLGYGEVVIGHRVQGRVGEQLKFFGKKYDVVGKLEQTGMGFDTSVFVTSETSKTLAKDCAIRLGKPLKGDKSQYSTIMVKLKPGYASEEVAREITKKYAKDGLFGLYSKKFVNKISSNLIVVSRYITVILVIIWVLAILVIALMFALTLNERKKEMAILRVLGATRGILVKITLAEVLIISLYGTVIGTALASIAIFISTPLIAENVNLPFLLPGVGTIILYGVSCFIISILTAVLSSLYSALKASKTDIYEIMREND